jgi:ribosomal protein S27E
MKAKIIQKIHCPNCGSSAEQIDYHQQNLTEIACPQCDYLLLTSSPAKSKIIAGDSHITVRASSFDEFPY